MGKQADEIQELSNDSARALGIEAPKYAFQERRLGTGHALMCARDLIEQSSAKSVLVLFADSPLIQPETLKELIGTQQMKGRALELLSFDAKNPFGYGRILRDASGQVVSIVEEKDADEQQKLIHEANAGSCCFDRDALLKYLDELDNNNSQGEYYLTDMVKVFNSHNLSVGATLVQSAEEALGVNNRVQLWEASSILQARINTKHMLNGVTIIDPKSTYIGPEVQIEHDCCIWPNTILQGRTKIGAHTHIGSNTRIENSQIGCNCTIEQSIILDSKIASDVSVGPFAYIRPETHMEEGSKAGTHVEIKKSIIAKDAKVPHLSYIGDSYVGEKANIGAGTITCNYDGHKKHKTQIGAGAFIGSSTMLVAPVSVGAHSITGAGSVITRDIPDNSLGLERSEQIIKEDYVIKKQRQDK